MANQIIFGATITPTSAAMEVTINAGGSFTAGTFTTVGSNQQFTLTNVAAGSYAINAVGLRAVGYASTTTFYNPAALTVLAAVYDTTILIPSGGAATTANGVTLSGPAGTKVEFNKVASTGALPVHLDLLIGGTIVAGLDFEGSYIPGQFRFTTTAGAVYFNTNNTFQTSASGLTLT